MTTTPRRLNGDQGVTLLEMVFWTPWVIALFAFLPVQLGLWMHTGNLVTAAAHEAASAASLYADGDLTRSAEASARNLVKESPLVAGDSVVATVVESDGTVTVELRAEGPSLIPGLKFRYSAEAKAAKEQVR